MKDYKDKKGKKGGGAGKREAPGAQIFITDSLQIPDGSAEQSRWSGAGQSSASSSAAVLYSSQQKGREQKEKNTQGC